MAKVIKQSPPKMAKPGKAAKKTVKKAAKKTVKKVAKKAAKKVVKKAAAKTRKKVVAKTYGMGKVSKDTPPK